ncbi:hypothetical protein B0H19DRAFT_1085135 [Mycena capillaripes]|nr:hypothetical protein B0H19DRAFT_1085135 [Mycena capillaripes]
MAPYTPMLNKSWSEWKGPHCTQSPGKVCLGACVTPKLSYTETYAILDKLSFTAEIRIKCKTCTRSKTVNQCAALNRILVDGAEGQKRKGTKLEPAKLGGMRKMTFDLESQNVACNMGHSLYQSFIYS